MKENLELEKPELVKSFSFSINKEYKSPVIGKSYTGIKKNETLPNFVGSSIEYLKSWTETRNINVTTTDDIRNDCENNKITNQSVHSGTLVSSINSLNVSVCKNIAPSEEDITENE